MNIIRNVMFIIILASGAIKASQTTSSSDGTKPAPAKNSSQKTASKQPAQKTVPPKEKQPAQKQFAQKEKATNQSPAAQKKLKPSAASTAALLRQAATPGYIAPFEKMAKPALQKQEKSDIVKVQAQAPVLKKNPIFNNPKPAKVQTLGDVEIGNSSKKPIEILSITFSYNSTNSEDKNFTTSAHTQTHKITFPRGHIIPAQKKLAFTISMKNKETLQFAGIKSIETYSGIVLFDHPITDLSKPIVLSHTKKGKIKYTE